MAAASFACEGFLKKKRHKFNKWNRRWFRLCGNKLQWFTDQGDVEEVGSTMITAGSTLLAFDVRDGESDYKFSLKTPTYNRLYKVKAKHDLAMWVGNLRQVIKTENAQNPAAAMLNSRSIFLHSKRKDKLQSLFMKKRTNLSIKNKRTNENERGLVFGFELSNGGTPIFLRGWYEYLLRYGLQTSGLFRKPGENNLVQKLKDMYDKKENFDLQTEVGGSTEPAIHCVASVVKLFFRELKVFQECEDKIREISTREDDANTLSLLGNALAVLSSSHRKIIQDLCLFLHEVSKHSDRNYMTPENLAVCWTPTLFDVQDLKLLKPLMVTTTNFIKFADKIFRTGERASPRSTRAANNPVARASNNAPSSNLSGTDKGPSTKLPSGLPPGVMEKVVAAGWESKKTDDGRTFYFHRAEQRSSWSADGIVHCWIQAQSNGRRYFYHSHTQERRWDNPDD